MAAAGKHELGRTWGTPPESLAYPVINGDSGVQTAVLEGLASAVNHRRWFVELAVPHLGENPIEIGSGLGDYALEWARRFPRFTATEGDPGRLKILEDRLAGMPDVNVRHVLLPYTEEADYSGLVSYNVLEHIEDDVAALQSMARLVRPGGAIVLIVPAFPFAMSPVDVATGHFRRYTKRTLSDALQGAGLVIDQIHYVNALGLPCYFLATSVFGLIPREGPLVKAYDRLILPVTKALEMIFTPPWGQSVFSVARVPARGDTSSR
jgi:SAM-dependent methyltransferase